MKRLGASGVCVQGSICTFEIQTTHTTTQEQGAEELEQEQDLMGFDLDTDIDAEIKMIQESFDVATSSLELLSLQLNVLAVNQRLFDDHELWSLIEMLTSVFANILNSTESPSQLRPPSNRPSTFSTWNRALQQLEQGVPGALNNKLFGLAEHGLHVIAGPSDPTRSHVHTSAHTHDQTCSLGASPVHATHVRSFTNMRVHTGVFDAAEGAGTLLSLLDERKRLVEKLMTKVRDFWTPGMDPKCRHYAGKIVRRLYPEEAERAAQEEVRTHHHHRHCHHSTPTLTPTSPTRHEPSHSSGQR